MPFVSDEHREDGHTPCAPGDLCYLAYRKLVREWWDKRRWTTAHEQYRDMFGLNNEEAAKQLAWQVHFFFNVMRYETEKREENGDVK